MREIAKIDDYVIAIEVVIGYQPVINHKNGITGGKKYKVLGSKRHLNNIINYLIMDDFHRPMFYDHRNFMLESEFRDKQLKKIGI